MLATLIITVVVMDLAATALVTKTITHRGTMVSHIIRAITTIRTNNRLYDLMVTHKAMQQQTRNKTKTKKIFIKQKIQQQQKNTVNLKIYNNTIQ